MEQGTGAEVGAGWVGDSTARSHTGLELFKLLIICKFRNVGRKYENRNQISPLETTSPTSTHTHPFFCLISAILLFLVTLVCMRWKSLYFISFERELQKLY